MGTGNRASIRRLECRIGQLSRGGWSWTYLREWERDTHSKCLKTIFRSLFAKVLGFVSRGNSAASLQRSPTTQTPNQAVQRNNSNEDYKLNSNTSLQTTSESKTSAFVLKVLSGHCLPMVLQADLLERTAKVFATIANVSFPCRAEPRKVINDQTILL